ncbi:fimbrial biogenesis chaperone [Lysobacter brunescens]|uniref:Molecular chaperone n=1 Tax=Lysobacter brunescens TaxID=262323 RepID=A0ABW2YGX4_9GAMM
MNRNRWKLVCQFAALACMLASPAAFAGNYGVSPLDFQLTQQRRSGVLTITNEDKAPIALRVRAMRWTQDAQGVDVYEETNDLVFFPKRVDLQPGDKKIVRLGVNAVGQDAERAYRLFVDELPPPEDPTRDRGSRLSVLVSIGVPVFLTPDGAEAKLVVEQARFGDGLDVTVGNPGTSRVRLSRVMSGEGVELAQNIPGRYVFPGVRKQLRIPAAAPACAGGRVPLKLDAGATMTGFDAACAR